MVGNIFKNKYRICFFGILITGMILRFAFIWVAPWVQDERENIFIAKNISFSRENLNLPIEDELYHHPMLSVYGIKLGMEIFGENKFGVRFPNFIAGILTLLIVYFLMKNNFTIKEALLSMLFISLNPFHIGHSSLASNDSFLIFFSLLGIFMLWRAIKYNKQRLWVLSGFAIGLAYLSKEVAFILIPVLLVWILSSKKTFYLFKNKNLFIFLFIFLLIISPHLYWITHHGTFMEIFEPDFPRFQFFPTITGLNFFLVKPIYFILGRDYRMEMSWEWPMMDGVSGAILFLGSILSLRYFKDEFIRLLLIFFLAMIISCSFFEGEPWWAELALIPSVCLTCFYLSKRRIVYPQFKYFLWPLYIYLFFNAFFFLYSSKQNNPPCQFASFVDYNYDLLERYLKEGKFKMAVAEGERALNICPNEVRGHYFLGQAYLRTGLHFEAVNEWVEALDIEPNYLPAKEALIKESKKILYALLNIDEQSFDAEKYRLLGNIYFYTGFYKKAEKFLLKSIEKKSDNPRGFYYLGKLYAQKGLYSLSIEELKKSIAIDPGNYLFHYFLGSVYSKKGFYKEAIQEFKKTISLNPDYPRGYCGLEEIYLKIGREKDAYRMQNIAKSKFHDAVYDYYVLVRKEPF